MNEHNQETDFRLVERKRILRGLRNYDLYTDSGTSPIYTIEEKGGFFKKLIRVVFGEAMAGMRFLVKDEHGQLRFQLKKSVGPATTAYLRLLNAEGIEICRAGNPIKFKDDSFIEIFDMNKKIIFKSGLSHQRRWFPLHIYRSEHVQTDWLSATISGDIYMRLRREDSRIASSGNEYSLDFTEAPKSEEELINMVNFAILADYQFDHRND
ncbi:hypothetical protein [Parvicella tangerina]|uniref:Scramblase n=1 Tax=Parvicella tangerina TaxID=2829795 RepID=A0A916NHU7_9FLAO|nr:hypothetical protein [Parvicella tangerina]CAG5082391.1 hypothetical protein CRYO30217_01900 [Parvicella tangerina]